MEDLTMTDIETFLQDYSNVIWDEHKEEIMKYYNYLLQYENIKKTTSKFGKHFECCSWSNDTTTSGPDTCGCYYVDSYKEKLTRVVYWYKANTNKKNIFKFQSFYFNKNLIYQSMNYVLQKAPTTLRIPDYPSFSILLQSEKYLDISPSAILVRKILL